MTPQEERLGFLVTDVARLMRQIFAQRIDGDALTLAQARALVQIAREEGLRQVELAERLDVQPITLARLLDQLEAEGLVERRVCQADRRAYRLYLLPAAEAHLTEIRQLGETLQNHALHGLDVAQIEVLYSALRIMRSNLAQLRHQQKDDVS
ncbi:MULTISPECIES: MarR family winged helix-turn-helix transcriptional regulator [unclassified Uliginosibacterium]|uniref:MarR family winged helix-turn-helix transcriptional regulator n=1 Tax=unclassified Uliginosibacterium TaxID=2621521 RepID=UPI000C7C58B1|nr:MULTISPECIES: MarR family transcriptional regulator [unclassified Uliginosibacterium]MDO6384951.1 MarR family transcriptional regulator [Uliginosibacterium sp. 31-12]PLK48640.1 MarR family transcriptional regulator [Uliginosibacterium sp. TH139]